MRGMRTETGAHSIPKLRLTAFRLGMLLGTLPCLAALAWLHAWGSRPTFALQVEGAGLRQQGAAAVILSARKGEAVRQICRGPCDDLSLAMTLGDDAPSVRVAAADGRSLQTAGTYTTGGALSCLKVSASPELRINQGGREASKARTLAAEACSYGSSAGS
jgi:hypothetical protein